MKNYKFRQTNDGLLISSSKSIIGHIDYPKDAFSMSQDLKEDYLTTLASKLVKGLNKGQLSETFVEDEISSINQDTKLNTITI